ncbi:MAG: metallopeptidase family protein [Geminicoccaceae bacterium]|nr:metallopeptidase family protein [Geminicoccaceae bacterium]
MSRLPPDIDEIQRLAESVLSSLPDEIRALVGDVPITITDWPDEATLEAMEIDDPLDLTGLYRGTPIGERHAMTTPAEPEMIFLYRLPILVEWCERGVALEDVVFDVLTHEIGHHLGMDEDAVLRMEARDDDFP